MALSLGNPVIFCYEQQKARFYREVNSLAKFIQFETGTAARVVVIYTAIDTIRWVSYFFIPREKAFCNVEYVY